MFQAGDMARLPSLLVIGSGTSASQDAEDVGAWAATQSYNLVSGGGQGVMRAAAEGFFHVKPRKGVSIGILPGEYVVNGSRDDCQPSPGYPNEFVEVVIQTHLIGSKKPSHQEKIGPDSRNRVTVLSADFVVAVGGGDGTKSEADLAVRLGKPLVFYGPAESWHAEYPSVERVSSIADLSAALARAPRR
jgi:uncharacterized protein (TIGR00725 family)